MAMTDAQKVPDRDEPTDALSLPTVHELKTEMVPFHALRNGTKRFEFRKNDREFRTGDYLMLQEWMGGSGEYSGSAILARVLYISYGPTFGIPEGFCIMSIEMLEALHNPRLLSASEVTP